jgi:hypothetical protein
MNPPLEANVKKNQQLSFRVAAAAAMAVLFATSAFSESRPSNETRRRSNDGRGAIRRQPTASPRPSQSSVEVRGERATRDRSTSGRIERDRRRDDATVAPRERSRDDNNNQREWRDRGNRRDDRSRASQNRGSSSSRGTRDRQSNGTWRGDSRSRSSRNGGYNRGHDNRQRFHHHGRISNVRRYGSGYRIWVVGAPYPFFVPVAYYRHDRFRIGLSISLGGYYNPLGYYDYYDGYSDDRYVARSSARELRGVVESVDYRRDTFVIRNDATGSFVTVLLRDRREDVRPGDYVELSGEWSRSGVFSAYDVDLLGDADHDRDRDRW